MSTITYGEITARLAIAAGLGATIGLERELTKKMAGLRTHMMVSIGAALIMIISAYSFAGQTDPTRIAAQVVSGIGFLGAGTIIRTKDRVQGLTTAASLWTTSGIGLASGAGMWYSALITTAFALACLFLLGQLERYITYPRRNYVYLLILYDVDKSTVIRVISAILEAGGIIREMKSVDARESLASQAAGTPSHVTITPNPSTPEIPLCEAGVPLPQAPPPNGNANVSISVMHSSTSAEELLEVASNVAGVTSLSILDERKQLLLRWDSWSLYTVQEKVKIHMKSRKASTPGVTKHVELLSRQPPMVSPEQLMGMHVGMQQSHVGVSMETSAGRNVHYREAPSAMTGAPSGTMLPTWNAEPTSRRSTRVQAPWWRHLRRAEREKEKQDRVNELRAEKEKEDKEERETGFGPL